jgi:hypothetical protein
MTLRKLAAVDLALLALLVLASRLALLAHEAGGHALPALAFGAEKVEIRMTPLGGGHVKYRLTPTPAQVAVIKLGGMALNLAAGLAAWILARRMSTRGLAHLGLLMFGAGSVGGAIVYLGNGLYYGSGDPTGFAPRTLDISALQPLWLLAPPAAAAVAWLAARHWSDVLSTLVAPKGPAGRLGWTLATLGLAGAAYGGLWLLLRDAQVEGSTRQWRVEREIAKEVRSRAATAPPAAPAAVVKAEDVAHRVPRPIGPIVLYSTALLAGGISVGRRWTSGLPASWPAWGVGGLALGAAALVAGLTFIC